MLVDSHCHLDYPDFSEDFDQVLARADEAGIKTMMTICVEISKFPPILKIAQDHEQIYCTVGIHPHSAGKEELVTQDQLLKLAQDENVIGFGETGLDYFYEHSPRDLQEKQFRTHIGAAREAGLPIIVHTRDAEEDTLAILRDEMDKGAFAGLIHCFSATQEFADAVLEMGFYISVSGIVTFKKAQDLRDTIATVPIERLLVETDAPYLAPVPKRGKRNEPAFTAYTAETVAGLKKVDLATLAAQTTDNFFTLFTKAKRKG